MYDFYFRSKQRREEALGEAQRRSLAKRAKGATKRAFRSARGGPVFSGLLSLLE
jgi:hypothetical protein